MSEEVTVLSPERFEELAGNVPEDGFRRVIPLIMDSFGNERGRTFDTTQVAALAIGFMEMSAVIENQITHIGELQGEVDRLNEELGQERAKKGKLWRP